MPTYAVGFFAAKPPSANIYADDKFIERIPLEAGQTRRVKSGHAVIKVSVLFVGTMAACKRQKVANDGTLYDPGRHTAEQVVGTRRQEMAKEKETSAEAMRDRTLRGIAVDLVQNGVEGAVGQPLRPPSRTPKYRPQAQMDALREKIAHLDCLKDRSSESYISEVIEGKKVWVDGCKLSLLGANLKYRPRKMHREVVRLCLGDLVKEDGLTVTGAWGTVAVPAVIQEVANGYVQMNAEIGPLSNYHPNKNLRDFLYKTQQQHKAAPPAQMEEAAAHPVQIEEAAEPPAQMEEAAEPPAQMEEAAAAPAQMEEAAAAPAQMEKAAPAQTDLFVLQVLDPFIGPMAPGAVHQTHFTCA